MTKDHKFVCLTACCDIAIFRILAAILDFGYFQELQLHEPLAYCIMVFLEPNNMDMDPKFVCKGGLVVEIWQFIGGQVINSLVTLVVI